MTDWRTPYAALLEIADSPTYDDLVSRWEGFERAAKWFRRMTIHHRRKSEGRMWHGYREHRSDVRTPDLKQAMQGLMYRVIDNPVFADPRAEEMKFTLIEVVNGEWKPKTT